MGCSFLPFLLQLVLYDFFWDSRGKQRSKEHKLELVDILLSPECKSLFCLSFSEGWCGCGTINHHSGSRRSYRLFQTVHELRYIYHDKKTSEVQTRSFFLSGSFGLRDMDVHCFCLHWSERCPLPGESLQPLRVAHWGIRGRTGPACQWPDKWVWDIQQSLVLPRSFHAARMWYFSKVGCLPQWTFSHFMWFNLCMIWSRTGSFWPSFLNHCVVLWSSYRFRNDPRVHRSLSHELRTSNLRPQNTILNLSWGILSRAFTEMQTRFSKASQLRSVFVQSFILLLLEARTF